MSPWKRHPLRIVWTCGVRPGCEHRHWIFAWIHQLLWRTRTRELDKVKPPPAQELTRADVDEFTRRVRGNGRSRRQL